MRRSLPVLGVLLLLALLLGGLWWMLVPDPAGLGEASLTDPAAGEDDPPLDALPTSPEPSGTGADEANDPGPIALPTPAEPDAASPESDEATPAAEDREENPDRYTRKSRDYGGGRTEPPGPPTGKPFPVHEVKLEFEDGSAVKGAAMFHNERPVGKTDEAGVLRPHPGGPIDWYARSRWLWIGRRLWMKEQREANRGQGAWVQVMWSAGRQVRGVLRDRHKQPVAGAVITLVQDLAVQQLRWTATTDHLGGFAISDVSPSPVRIELSGEGLVRHAFPNWIAEGTPGATTEVQLKTARGRSLEVVLQGPRPVRDGYGTLEYVYAWPELIDGRRSEWTLKATGDHNGVVRLMVADGLDLKLTAWGRRHARRTVIAFGNKLPTTIRVPLRKYGRYAEPWVPVHCIDALTSRPVKPQVVLARRSEHGWEIGQNIAPTVVTAICHPLSAPDHPVLDLRDLDAGEYDFLIYQPGYIPVTLRARATEAGIYPPFKVVLHRAGAPPKITVADFGSGDPIAHASLGVQVPAGQGPFIHELALGGLYSGTQGVITPALPPGRYVLQGRASGYRDKVERTDLRAGDDRVIKLGRLPQSRRTKTR